MCLVNMTDQRCPMNLPLAAAAGGDDDDAADCWRRRYSAVDDAADER